MITELTPRLSPRIQARLQLCQQAAQGNTRQVEQRMGLQRRQEFAGRLSAVVRGAGSVSVRLRELYRFADEHMALTNGIAACHRGCAHCCHTAVGLFRPEAQMLGKAIGRRPRIVVGHHPLTSVEVGYQNPCAFLHGNECSIYEHRPLACRILINIDSEPTLCELTPPALDRVPTYLNVLPFHEAYAQICHSPHAGDIRLFFPRS